MRSQFLQSPGLSPYGRRGGVVASSAYAVNGFTPATVADYQAETYVVNGAALALPAKEMCEMPGRLTKTREAGMLAGLRCCTWGTVVKW